MKKNNEIWKDIPQYEGLYQVSNLGNVKSLERYRIGKENSLVIVPEKILKPVKIKKGYLRVGLSKNGKIKRYLVHRLVYIAFNGDIPEGLQINHIDEIKTNNQLENLNLMTCKENNNWGTRNIALSKSVIQYDLNDNFIKEWPSAMEVQRQLGFDQGNISKCCRGEYKTSYGYKWKYKELEKAA